MRWRRKRHLQGGRDLRERTAHAVLRLMGGRGVEADEVGEEIADLLGGNEGGAVPFDRRERIMISGVLGLAERPIRTLMTNRTDVERIDLDEPQETIHDALLRSPHSRLLVIRDGDVDEPLGYVHKKELLRELLQGQDPDIEQLLRIPPNLPDSASVLGALEEMRKASTHVAFVVNEFGGFEGLVTMTDILESIAGELPDAYEVDGLDIEPCEDGWKVSGAVNLNLLGERLGFSARPGEDYQTLAGLAMSLLDRLPVTGDALEVEGWKLEVIEVKERRVNRLLLKPLDQVG
ncbi:Hemolysin C [compost metagenome]